MIMKFFSEKIYCMNRKGINRILESYEVATILRSFGKYKEWKKSIIEELNLNYRSKIICISRTGDFPLLLLKSFPYLDLEIFMINKNVHFLNNQRDLYLDMGYYKNIHWIHAKEYSLPFKSDSIDNYVIIFSLNNDAEQERHQTIKEAYRVLKPEGKFICLNFGSNYYSTSFRWIENLYNFYSFNFITYVSKLFTEKNKDSQCLCIENENYLLNHEDVKNSLQELSFQDITFKSLPGKVSYIYIAYKNKI